LCAAQLEGLVTRCLHRALLAATVLALFATSARASFHLIKIVEVFPGTAAAPSAQYVKLQMYSSGQTFLTGVYLKFYNREGAVTGTATFASGVSVGTSQATILIATAQAGSVFNVTPDLVMNGYIVSAGGRICWASDLGVIDCVAWGDDPGTPNTIATTDVGMPFSASGLPLGDAMTRRLDLAGSPSLLEAADDTNNSAHDFVSGVPAPRNNAGQSGTLPASTCGNTIIEGLEQCDDGNLTGGDGCSSACRIEAHIFIDGFEAPPL
jgi:cysteine-rich repeat protein